MQGRACAWSRHATPPRRAKNAVISGSSKGQKPAFSRFFTPQSSSCSLRGGGCHMSVLPSPVMAENRARRNRKRKDGLITSVPRGTTRSPAGGRYSFPGPGQYQRAPSRSISSYAA